jgi:WD40 repeat protein
MLSHSALNDQLWLYIFSFIDAEYACKSLLLIHKKWLRLIYQDQDLWKRWYFKYPWFLGLSNLDKSIYNTYITNNNYNAQNGYGSGNYRQHSKREWNELFLRRVKTDNNWKRGRFVERRLERAHTLAVAAIQCDESVLVTGSYDESIKVWDISKGECVRVLYNTGWVCTLVF